MCSEQNKVPNDVFMPILTKLRSSTAVNTSFITFSRKGVFKNRGRITVEMIGHNSQSIQSWGSGMLFKHYGCGYYRAVPTFVLGGTLQLAKHIHVSFASRGKFLCSKWSTPFPPSWSCKSTSTFLRFQLHINNFTFTFSSLSHEE